MNEDLEQITGNCFFEGIRNYQVFMDKTDQATHPGQNAYCLTADNKCKYYEKVKDIDYCKANKRQKQ